MSLDTQDKETDAERRSFQLYVDESGRIAMARGNADTWLGAHPKELEGRYVSEYAAEESQFAVSEILVHAALRDFMPASLFFMTDTRTGTVSGFEVTGKPQNFNQLYRLNFVQDPAMEYGPQSKNSRQGFVGAVERAMAQALDEEADIDMTFVDIGDVGRLGAVSGLDSEGVRRFTEQVEDRLKAESLGGDSLGRMEAGKYGVVHGRDTDMGALRTEIEDYARDLDPEGQALSVGTSTVALDSEALDPEAIRSAVEHAVDEFAETGIDAVIFDTLADSRASYLDRVETRTTLLNRCLEADVLTCAFVPVCDIAQWSNDHVIAEFRANLDDDGLGAAEILKLTAGDHDLRARVDDAQCRYILTDATLDQTGVAVPVAIRSLMNEDVLRMLLTLKAREPNRRLLLRLDGLDEIPFEKVHSLAILRKAGFAIALQGKDIGAVTAERLQSLPADFILLDPSFVVNIDQLKRGLPMLANMVQRCQDFGIKIIFEGVIEAASARLLSKIDGAFCSGPYFGEPVEDLADLNMPMRS